MKHNFIHNKQRCISEWFFCFILFSGLTLQAQLVVRVSPVKITGQIVVLPLAMKNGLSEKIESARAVVFLLDEKGKMVGQTTKWVIGGTKDKSGLEPKNEAAYNFVVQSAAPLVTTNLTAKVAINRLILQGGKLADPIQDVKIENETK
jgi:hypothetical protein